ncbi:hypothetical protein GOP47_0025036 [Adiantum capillus-veneris]|uniref:C3H1-type domain-containing protein n=1 Tax=Adiantum capillus-veneris TaxID=13818 RepID=A0A9D4U5H7_ADICA|nr:hypothetical protein GOP47_0025036 [Adiantum capillus-veneris]
MGKGRKKRGVLASSVSCNHDDAGASHGSAPAHQVKPVFFNAERSSVGGAASYSQDTTGATFYGETSFSSTPKSTSPVPCRYFQRGYCRYGGECRFQHSEGPSTAPRYPGVNTRPPKARKSSSAPFNPIPGALTKKERSPEECRDWYLTGSCPRYRTCRYAHPRNAPSSIMKEEEIFGNKKTFGKGFGIFGDFGLGGGIFDDDDKDDEMGQRMRNGGFTDDDIYELSLQGIKPWDPEAGAALAVLKGWDMDDGFGYCYDNYGI